MCGIVVVVIIVSVAVVFVVVVELFLPWSVWMMLMLQLLFHTAHS